MYQAIGEGLKLFDTTDISINKIMVVESEVC